MFKRMKELPFRGAGGQKKGEELLYKRTKNYKHD